MKNKWTDYDNLNKKRKNNINKLSYIEDKINISTKKKNNNINNSTQHKNNIHLDFLIEENKKNNYKSFLKSKEYTSQDENKVSNNIFNIDNNENTNNKDNTDNYNYINNNNFYLDNNRNNTLSCNINTFLQSYKKQLLVPKYSNRIYLINSNNNRELYSVNVCLENLENDVIKHNINIIPSFLKDAFIEPKPYTNKNILITSKINNNNDLDTDSLNSLSSKDNSKLKEKPLFNVNTNIIAEFRNKSLSELIN